MKEKEVEVCHATMQALDLKANKGLLLISLFLLFLFHIFACIFLVWKPLEPLISIYVFHGTTMDGVEIHVSLLSSSIQWQFNLSIGLMFSLFSFFFTYALYCVSQELLRCTTI